MIVRPDAVIQGIGCLAMAATSCFVVHALAFGSELLDLPVGGNSASYAVPLMLLIPCCCACGCMMLWTGCGGSYPASSIGIRCDLPSRADHREV